MKSILLAVLFSAVPPCMAEVTDQASARAALGSASARDRLDAITFLGAQRGQAAYEVLSGHFGAEKDAYLRVQIVESLDVNASTWAYRCAAAAAADANKAVRQAAAEALARRAGDPETDDKLKALAGDPEAAVGVAAINFLSMSASTSAVTIIGDVLSDAKAPKESRRAAARSLAGMKDKKADAELQKHLSDPDPEIKAAAVSRKPAGKKPQAPAKKPAAKPAR